MGDVVDTGISIAAVDNDLAILDSLQMLLTLNGYSVRTYDQARDFLDDVNRWTPHCLILEPNMDGLDGAFVAERLASNYLFVPIIGLTAHPYSARTRELADVGVHSMLSKPVATDTLLSQVSSALFNQWGLQTASAARGIDEAE